MHVSFRVPCTPCVTPLIGRITALWHYPSCSYRSPSRREASNLKVTVANFTSVHSRNSTSTATTFTSNSESQPESSTANSHTNHNGLPYLHPTFAPPHLPRPSPQFPDLRQKITRCHTIASQETYRCFQRRVSFATMICHSVTELTPSHLMAILRALT